MSARVLRVFGVDPGSERHAWAVLDVAPRKPGQYVAHGYAEDIDTLVDLFRYWAGTHGRPPLLDVLAIESAVAFIPRESTQGKAGTATAIATRLMAQQGHMGELRRAAKDLDFPRVEMTANAWRTTVVGVGSPDDARVKATLQRLVHGIPKGKTNENHRDAMGVALAAGWTIGDKAPSETAAHRRDLAATAKVRRAGVLMGYPELPK